MDQLLEMVGTLNPFLLYPALAFVVFLVVKVLDKFGFLKDGNMQRIGVIVGTFVSTELLNEGEQAVGAVLIGLVSVAFNEFSKWVGKKVGSE